MEIFLVRHGDAESPHVNRERPLSSKGRQQVARLSQFIADNPIPVETIFHSGILRAQQSAQIIADALGLVRVESLQGLKPDAPVDSMALLIEEFTTNAMLVGHLPFMSLLATQLVGGSKRHDTISFYTATAACLSYQGNSRWSIEWVVSAEALG